MSDVQTTAENKVLAAIQSMREYAGGGAKLCVENMMSDEPHRIRANPDKSVVELAGEDVAAGRKIAVTAYDVESEQPLVRVWVSL